MSTAMEVDETSGFRGLPSKHTRTFKTKKISENISKLVPSQLHEIKVKTLSTGNNKNKKNTFLVRMDEKNCKEDVYEFKSSKEATPVRGNSTSPDLEKNSSENKNDKSGEGYSGGETESMATKRSISEVGENEDGEDDTKKKKRKEKEIDGKEILGSIKNSQITARGTSVRNVGGNVKEAGKPGSHLVGKNCGAAVSKPVSANPVVNVNTDGKSPSSPKANPTNSVSNASSSNVIKVDTEQEDSKSNSDGEKMDQGPKVPPLKIVIPQQTANEPEPGNRNGKNSNSRHHQALPYVVTTNSNDGEKETTRSRSASPTDLMKADEKKDPAIGMLSAEDQKSSLHHQRVLRSSHRSGCNVTGEVRSQESSATRNSNGNGQNTGPNAGQLAVSNNPNNTNSNSSTQQSQDNPSPTSQNRTSPLPQGDSSSINTLTTVSVTSESSTTAINSNYRGTTTVTKTSQGSSTTTSTVSSEEKTTESNVESSQGLNQISVPTSVPVELHPRKRKLKHNKEVKESPPPQIPTERCESITTSTEIHPHEQPVKNCYQLFLDIRKQIERRRKGLFPVQPKPPQGFKDYLMNRCTYVLAGNASTRQIPSSPLPQNLSSLMKDLFTEQEKERHRLRLQHVIEKEKLVLSVEQEILRVHGRAARALANQSLPFSACTILKDEEVYNLITPEQEEKDRNARSRYNGRLFLSWLQDVDDKWEKIKEAMLLRHHNEAESLHAVQKMDWEWKMKELGFCEFKSKPVILDNHVPIVHVSDDFDLLPA